MLALTEHLGCHKLYCVLQKKAKTNHILNMRKIELLFLSSQNKMWLNFSYFTNKMIPIRPNVTIKKKKHAVVLDSSQYF